MPLYTYVKRPRSRRKTIVSTLSIGCIALGTTMLLWVLYPIVAFEFVYAAKFEPLMRPVPSDEFKQAFSAQLASVLSGSSTDYTKASTWFPQAVNIRLANSVTEYRLSIPKLGIQDAVVKIGSENLDESLIHFTGANPGQNGNPVIFGHSTIPWLYNPKNYKTIFTKLVDLNEGDSIFVTADNVTYRYAVTSMKVVKPDDVAVLQQQYDDAYLTLVTCVPAGTWINRLIVRTRLMKL